MRTHLLGTLLAVLALSACGEQLVQFPNGGNNVDAPNGNPDDSMAPIDVETDVSVTVITP